MVCYLAFLCILPLLVTVASFVHTGICCVAAELRLTMMSTALGTLRISPCQFLLLMKCFLVHLCH
jgi:hypothetical protein